MKRKVFTPPSCQFIILALLLVTICKLSFTQITVKSDGKIGIGTTDPSTYVEIYSLGTKFSFPSSPSILINNYYSTQRIYPATNHTGYLGTNTQFWCRIYADKMYYVYAPSEYSDRKLKKNIEPLEGSLSKILQLRGVSYDLDAEAAGFTSSSEMDPGDDLDHIGLIAQEVLEILPEIVNEDSLGYSIQYTRIIPLLIEAIKEQQEMIFALEKKIKDDKEADSKDPELKNSTDKSVANADATELNEPFLGQNSPNPFHENTTITYYLPSDIKNALFYVYDLQGKQIKSINLAEREFAEVVIYGNELQAGIYYYSILADGRVIGMEKMVLTD
ncbi:MAG: tail fiber domain-containing protein [Bacteroidales bacterium]|nr:tail fiber domain-containing protein [Bacteroidales bacterium]